MKKDTKEKILSISKDILLTIGMVGFVATATFSGNAIQLLKHTSIGQRKSKIKNYELNKYVKRLMDRNLLKVYLKNDIEYLGITQKGKSLLFKYKLEGLKNVKPRKWDKKYRVVIFDISENVRGIRDKLRVMIKGFGFIQLQQSVWIYPYPCKDIIELLKNYLCINNEIIYMTVDSVENDKWLKDIFKLD